MFPIAWTIIKMLDFQSQYFEIRNITPVFFLIQKTCFKAKKLRTFKISLDSCHIKIYLSLKPSAIY